MVMLFILIGNNNNLNAQHYIESQKIVASDRNKSDFFGSAVSIYDSIAVIGARFHDFDLIGQDSLHDAGAAYIYQQDNNGNWIFQQKIISSDRTAGDNFGTSVGVYENYIVIGAPNDTGTLNNFVTLPFSGSAYIFEYNLSSNQWIEIQKIEAYDHDTLSYFGHSVAIDNDYITIGSHFKDDIDNLGANIERSGTVYIYHKSSSQNNWNFEQKITASDKQAYDEFGYSVSIDSNIIVVGAHHHDYDNFYNNTDYHFNAGAVYIFEKQTNGNWLQINKLISFDRDSADYFGHSVSVYNNNIIVGAHMEDHNTFGISSSTVTSAGSCYIFERLTNGSWSFLQKIVASDRLTAAQFGHSVDINDHYAIVGARLENRDSLGLNPIAASGAVYIYKRSMANTWDEFQKVVALDREYGDDFGYSVGINESSQDIIISALEEDMPGTPFYNNAGAAYIFDWNCNPVCPSDETYCSSNQSCNLITPYEIPKFCDPNFSFSILMEGQPPTNPFYSGIHDIRYHAYDSYATILDSCLFTITVDSVHADINCDCCVNIQDASILVASFGTSSNDPTYYVPADINNDGYINLQDLSKLITNIGNGCPDQRITRNEIDILKLINTTSDISLFPNPVASNLNVMSKNDKIIGISILSLNGQILLDQKYDNQLTTIDISQLNVGMYLIQINTEKSISIQSLIKN